MPPIIGRCLFPFFHKPQEAWLKICDGMGIFGLLDARLKRFEIGTAPLTTILRLPRFSLTSTLADKAQTTKLPRPLSSMRLVEL